MLLFSPSFWPKYLTHGYESKTLKPAEIVEERGKGISGVPGGEFGWGTSYSCMKPLCTTNIC
jgi:hypothetical protein